MLRRTKMLVAGAALALILVLGGVGLAVAERDGGHALMPWGHAGMMRGAHEASFRDIKGTQTGRFVTFVADAPNATLRALDLRDRPNATHPLVASITLARVPNATPATIGGGWRMRGVAGITDGAGTRVTIVDSPLATFLVTSPTGTTVTIALPAGANVTQHDAVDHWSPAGATITYASGQTATLVLSRNATLAASGGTIAITLPAHGHAAFSLERADGWEHHGFGHGPHAGGYGFGWPTRGGPFRHG